MRRRAGRPEMVVSHGVTAEGKKKPKQNNTQLGGKLRLIRARFRRIFCLTRIRDKAGLLFFSPFCPVGSSAEVPHKKFLTAVKAERLNVSAARGKYIYKKALKNHFKTHLAVGEQAPSDNSPQSYFCQDAAEGVFASLFYFLFLQCFLFSTGFKTKTDPQMLLHVSFLFLFICYYNYYYYY